MKEGILIISGNVNPTFENITNYESRKIDSNNNYLYYIQPSYCTFSINLEPISNEGKISIIGVKPTIIINFPETMYYDIDKGMGPQYFRINIDQNFDDTYLFNFFDNVNWLEGTMFEENGKLNEGIFISKVNINKTYAGKTFTAVYNYTFNIFRAEKDYKWITINEYEVKFFSLYPGEEAHFIYAKSSIGNATFENGYFGNKVEIYIYLSEYTISYDIASKNYSNYIAKYSSWKEITVGKQKSNVFLIIKASESYSDYISFKSNYLTLNNDKPQEYNNFYEYNCIYYSLNLENGENAIEILANVENNQLTIGLYENEIEIENCTQKACHFRPIKNFESKYYIIIKNLEIKLEKSTKMYLFYYRIKDYSFGNIFITKNFLSNFEYKFKLYEDLIDNIVSSKELIINYQPPSNSELYNITISSNIQDNYILIKEQISNKNYGHYYYNLLNETNISEIIITIKGQWSEDLFLPPEKIAISFGGPFYFNFPNEKIMKKANSIGNIIYYTIKNNISNSEYIFSLPEHSRILDGKIFKENKKLNDKYINMKKYITSKTLFKNNNIITIEYNGNNNIDADIYYETLRGEIIEINDCRQFKSFELNFEKNKYIYFLGLYQQKPNLAYAYFYTPDQNVQISYQNKFNLSPILPNYNSPKFISQLFALDMEYDIIEFNMGKQYLGFLKREFIIFNPNVTQEILSYSKQGKYLFQKTKLKNLIL